MDINITLFIQGLAFFAVAWLVMKFGWPNIMSAIEERQAKIADGLAAADRSKKDLAQAEEKINEVLREARSKANEIIAQAEARRLQIIDAAKEEGISEGLRMKATAQSEIDQSVSKAREELRKQVSVLAMAGAEKVIRREIDSTAHKALLDELAAEI
ncbi:MAG: F0F1 ATP synthase subunit B [Arenimonas sp.]|nr:F0F1 ATP synthase subunit B [Arenimonas sp.]